MLWNEIHAKYDNTPALNVAEMQTTYPGGYISILSLVNRYNNMLHNHHIVIAQWL